MTTVSKREICDRIAGKRPDLKKNDIADIVGLFMEAVGDALVRHERVELRDFGVFTPKERKGRTARNPKTGAPVDVPATVVCAFKPGKELKQRLADSRGSSDVDPTA
ncbi:MAG: HU family DNA-binding protein [Nitrospira sp.]